LEERIQRGLEAMFSPEIQARQKIDWEEASNYLYVPLQNWPSFKVQWSLTREEQYYALDSYRPESFAEDYPEGLHLIHGIALRVLDLCLCAISRQTPDEFWTVGIPGKKARVIADFIAGKALTPPLIRVCEPMCLLVAGGNQRLAVARAKGEDTVPILVPPEEAELVQELLGISLKYLSCK
jgi:hypothetical protein